MKSKQIFWIRNEVGMDILLIEFCKPIDFVSETNPFVYYFL